MIFYALVHVYPLRRLGCQPIRGYRTATSIGLFKPGEPGIDSDLSRITFVARSLAGLLFTLIIVPAEDVLHYHVRHASVVCRPIVFNNRSADQIATEVLTYSIAENLCWRKLLRG